MIGFQWYCLICYSRTCNDIKLLFRVSIFRWIAKSSFKTPLHLSSKNSLHFFVTKVSILLIRCWVTLPSKSSKSLFEKRNLLLGIPYLYSDVISRNLKWLPTVLKLCQRLTLARSYLSSRNLLSKIDVILVSASLFNSVKITCRL